MAETVPLTEEQVLASLQTRGFEDAFVSTPLRDFWGKLKSITGEMRTGQAGSYLVALYNFEEIEVIDSVEAYTEPVAQIDVPASNKAKSKMGYLGASMDKFINPGVAPDVTHLTGAKNQDSLKGKKLHMQFTPGHLVPRRGSDNQWEDVPISCWVVTEIAGEGAAPVATATPATPASQAQVAAPPSGLSITEIALDLLNNKNVQQWHQVVFNNLEVKANTQFLNTIIDGSFLSSMEELAKVVKGEDGVYKVVQGT